MFEGKTNVLTDRPRPCHVLILQDQPLLREVLADTGLAEGFHVHSCPDMPGLLATLAGLEGPVLAYIDIHLEEGDGSELIGPLSQHEGPLRIRFMSDGGNAHAIGARMMAEGRGMSVGRTLLKPFPHETFREALERDLASLEDADAE